MAVVVRRYVDILTIIINFPYSTCISSFFGSSIPTSLFILKMFFRSLLLLHNNYGYVLCVLTLRDFFPVFLTLALTHRRLR